MATKPKLSPLFPGGPGQSSKLSRTPAPKRTPTNDGTGQKPSGPAIKPGQSRNPVPAGQIGSVPRSGRSSGGGQRST